MDNAKYFEFYNSFAAIEIKINNLLLNEREKWLSLIQNDTLAQKPTVSNLSETKPNLGNISKAYPHVITVSEANPIFGNLPAANPNVDIVSEEKLDVVNVPKAKLDINNVTKAKQHVCKYCSKVYKSYTGMYNHVQAKHLQKKYTCQVCTKQFSQKFHLQRHLNNVCHTKCAKKQTKNTIKKFLSGL
jgi:uncharacterized Zn-finger protein